MSLGFVWDSLFWSSSYFFLFLCLRSSFSSCRLSSFSYCSFSSSNLLSFFPSFVSSLSSPSLLLPFFSLLLFLPWLLLSPSVLQWSACSSRHSFVSFYYFFAVFCRFLFPCLSSPPVSVLPSPPICRLPSLPALFPVVSSCYFFPTITSWATLAVVTCAFLSVVSFTTPVLSLVPPPNLLPPYFLLRLLLFLLSPICRL